MGVAAFILMMTGHIWSVEIVLLIKGEYLMKLIYILAFEFKLVVNNATSYL